MCFRRRYERLHHTTNGEKQKMNNNYQKETQTKLTKGLLDMIVLKYLNEESMHGYQMITKIRKGFGVYLGPSTVYPLLGLLEKKGYVTSVWNMCTVRPRKMYKLTNEGKNVLHFAENSLKLIVKNMGTDDKIRMQAAPLIYTRSTLQNENPILAVC
jgi:PadR family transcriptional regulator, regulatory protein PadR